MRIVQTKVFLQYGKTGEQLSASGFQRVHEFEQHQFVDLDNASGGYPYGTSIDRAYDFKTVEKALEYSRGVEGFHPRTVTITYEFTQHENLQKCKQCDGSGDTSTIVDHDHEYNAVWETKTCTMYNGTGKS